MFVDHIRSFGKTNILCIFSWLSFSFKLCNTHEFGICRTTWDGYLQICDILLDSARLLFTGCIYRWDQQVSLCLLLGTELLSLSLYIYIYNLNYYIQNNYKAHSHHVHMYQQHIWSADRRRDRGKYWIVVAEQWCFMGWWHSRLFP